MITLLEKIAKEKKKRDYRMAAAMSIPIVGGMAIGGYKEMAKQIPKSKVDMGFKSYKAMLKNPEVRNKFIKKVLSAGKGGLAAGVTGSVAYALVNEAYLRARPERKFKSVSLTKPRIKKAAELYLKNEN